MSDDQISYRHIAQRFYNRPLWLQPSAAETISGFIYGRMGQDMRGGAATMERGGESTQYFEATRSPGGFEGHTPRASRFYGTTAVDEAGRPTPYRRTAEGVGLITAIGELVNRGAWVGASSGLVSYEGFTYSLLRAAKDQTVKTIMVDMESPGGEAVGAFEAAAVMRQVAKEKTVIALCNGLMASAGYAIASGASQIVTIPTGMVGSIGVVMMHLDFSEYLKNEGIKPTMIFTGAHKVDGNPYEPLPEAVRDRFQQESQSFYDQFVATVAAGRSGMSDARVRATEARVFKGQDAVDVGLADSVGTFEEVLAELSSGSSGRASTSTSMKGSTMSTETLNTAASLAAISTSAQLQAAFPALCTELMTTAATAERGRIFAIDALPAKGHEALLATMKADPTKTAPDAAMAVLNAERGTRVAAATELSTGIEAAVDGLKTANTPAGQSGGDKPAANTKEAWEAEFNKSEALQAEFGGAGQVATYVAFKQAESDGKVRRMSKVG